MKGRVTVQEAGSPLPNDLAEVEAMAADQRARSVALQATAGRCGRARPGGVRQDGMTRRACRFRGPSFVQ